MDICIWTLSDDQIHWIAQCGYKRDRREVRNKGRQLSECEGCKKDMIACPSDTKNTFKQHVERSIEKGLNRNETVKEAKEEQAREAIINIAIFLGNPFVDGDVEHYESPKALRKGIKIITDQMVKGYSYKDC